MSKYPLSTKGIAMRELALKDLFAVQELRLKKRLEIFSPARQSIKKIREAVATQLQGIEFNEWPRLSNPSIYQAMIKETKQPTEPEFDGEEEPEFQPCSDCDGHPACVDFGCAVQHGLGHLLQNPL